jgi:hypothetical protein
VGAVGLRFVGSCSRFTSGYSELVAFLLGVYTHNRYTQLPQALPALLSTIHPARPEGLNCACPVADCDELD